MGATQGLQLRLLVGRQDEDPLSKGFVLPKPLIKIQHRPGLLQEVGILGKDPGTVIPRADRILVEDAPDGAGADGGDDRRQFHFHLQFAETEATEGNPPLCRKLTRDCFDTSYLLRGKNRTCVRVVDDPLS